MWRNVKWLGRLTIIPTALALLLLMLPANLIVAAESGGDAPQAPETSAVGVAGNDAGSGEGAVGTEADPNAAGSGEGAVGTEANPNDAGNGEGAGGTQADPNAAGSGEADAGTEADPNNAGSGEADAGMQADPNNAGSGEADAGTEADPNNAGSAASPEDSSVGKTDAEQGRSEEAEEPEPVIYNGTWADLQAFINSDAVKDGDIVVIDPDAAVLGPVAQTVTVGKSITIASSAPGTAIVMEGSPATGIPAEETENAKPALPHFAPAGAAVTLTLKQIRLQNGGALDSAIVIGEGVLVEGVLATAMPLAAAAPITPTAARLPFNGTWSELQAYLDSDAVQPGDTVILNTDTSSPLGKATSTVHVNKSITITANNVNGTIVASAPVRFFDTAGTADPVTLTLEEIHLNGGGVGGGVWVSKPTDVLIMQHGSRGDDVFILSSLGVAKISNGYQDHGGGGIDSNGTVILNDGAVVTNNTAAADGGGIYSTGTLSVGKPDVNSYNGGVISGNKASGNGGGIYSASGTVTIEGNVSSNTAGGDGGGVYMTDLANLTVGASANFSSSPNTAVKPSGRDPANDALYAANIHNTRWSSPYTQGYNNYDINQNYAESLTATAVAAGPGTAAVNGQASAANVVSFQKLTLSATPNPGTSFLNWTVDANDAVLSSPTDPNATIVMGHHNVTVTAHFGTVSSITVNPGTGGTGKSDKPTAADGETITLTATPDPGYVFDHWSVDSGTANLQDPNSPTTTFPMPNGDVTVTPHFTRAYTVDVETTTGGTAAGSKTTAKAGEQVSLTAIPSSGYMFDYWTVNAGGAVLSKLTDPNASFTMPSSNTTITAYFHQIPESNLRLPPHSAITVNGGNGGTATGDKSIGEVGESIIITARPNPGYVFDHWSVDGGTANLQDPNSPETSFNMPDGSVTLTAHFKLISVQPPPASTTPGTTTTTPASDTTPITTLIATSRSPQTGDGADLGVWASLVAIALVGIVGGAVLWRKTRKTGKQ